jgi:hypothetical protein
MHTARKPRRFVVFGDKKLEPLSPGGIHVLFVGNSLTYVNDMPGMVAALGVLSGDTIRVATAAEPDLPSSITGMARATRARKSRSEAGTM